MRSTLVAIRTDSSAQIGSGHLVRCLTLADELRRRGAEVWFVSRELPGNLIHLIAERGYRVARLPPPVSNGISGKEIPSWLGVTQGLDADETLAAIDGRVDWMVVDHYGLDRSWEQRIRRSADRVFVIDDLADRPHDADALLDQNFRITGHASRYDALVAPGCRQMLGPRFAMLQPVYRLLRAAMVPRNAGVRRVLVFFGAHDAQRTVLRVVEALRRPEFAALNVDVVPGSDPQLAAEVKLLARDSMAISVHDSPASLAYLLARADLAVGACGTTTWERACLGLPSLVATIAANQIDIADALARSGCIRLAGPSASLTVEDWAFRIAELVGDGERMASLSGLAGELTDGHGVGRVASVLMAGVPTALFLRKASAADEALLLQWANDAGMRRHSFSNASIAAESHRLWFAARLADADCDLLIAEDAHGLPLGQVRYDLDANARELLVDVSIDPTLRRLGLGSRVLREALRWGRARYPGHTAIAEVLLANEPSLRLFQTAGFEPASTRREGSVTLELRLKTP